VKSVMMTDGVFLWCIMEESSRIVTVKCKALLCTVYVLTGSVAFLEVEVTYWNLKPLFKKMCSIIYVPIITQQFHNFLFFVNL
jgi:hypothetical protein